MKEELKLRILTVIASLLGILSLFTLAYASRDGFDVTLENIDPTRFNALSAFLSLVSTSAFGLSVSLAFTHILSWHMRLGHDLPVSILGNMPGNTINSTEIAHALKWTLPVIVMTSLFFIADLSHTFADTGLDFVSIVVKGPTDTIWNLAKRNKDRLFETAGDPVEYASPTPTIALTEEGQINSEGLPQSRKLNALIDAFMEEVDLIARGGSSFVAETQVEVRVNALDDQTLPEYADSSDSPWFDYAYGAGNTFLTEISRDIPISCRSTEMVSIEQTLTSDGLCEPQNILSTALVPNCTMNAERSSGIFGERLGTASIVERAAHIFSLPREVDSGLVIDSTIIDPLRVPLTAESRELARYRSDWKTGRAVYGIDGVRIGSTQINFGAVVMAAGAPRLNFDVDYVSGEVQASARPESLYGLFAEVTGRCPPRPSSLPNTDDMTCMVAIELRCPTFLEDAGVESDCGLDSLFGAETECKAMSAEVVWGKGFEVDSELVAVVAGIYGRIKHNDPFRPLSTTVFAAMFAIGSLDTAPSISEIVRPRINGTFIFFTVIPFLLTSIVLFAVILCARDFPSLPIPQDAWQLLVFGGEQHESLPRMKQDKTEYPELDPSFVLTSPSDSVGVGEIQLVHPGSVSAGESNSNGPANATNTVSQTTGSNQAPPAMVILPAAPPQSAQGPVSHNLGGNVMQIGEANSSTRGSQQTPAALLVLPAASIQGSRAQEPMQYPNGPTGEETMGWNPTNNQEVSSTPRTVPAPNNGAFSPEYTPSNGDEPSGWNA